METETRICAVCKNEFRIVPEDAEYWAKFKLPVPEECHICLWKGMLSHWVFGKFRKLKSPLSGKTVITTFPEMVKFPVYSYSEWVSDVWDPMSYGQDYDPNAAFFEQFRALRDKVPHPHSSGSNSVNSDWCDDVWSCKDCYLCRSLLECEHVSYGYRVLNAAIPSISFSVSIRSCPMIA